MFDQERWQTKPLINFPDPNAADSSSFLDPQFKAIVVLKSYFIFLEGTFSKGSRPDDAND